MSCSRLQGVSIVTQTKICGFHDVGSPRSAKTIDFEGSIRLLDFLAMATCHIH